jgi:hypothetical protein
MTFTAIDLQYEYQLWAASSSCAFDCDWCGGSANYATRFV